jgi:hypothetical protein
MRKTTLLIAAGLVSLVTPLALALLIVACAGSAGSGHSSRNNASTSHVSGSRGQAPWRFEARRTALWSSTATAPRPIANIVQETFTIAP